MPLKLRKNNSLELGSIYNYEEKNYLIVRSDYEKSKGYEINNLEDIHELSYSVVKNFYNEDSSLLARPKLSKRQGKNFKIGDYIMQDGLVYILDSINSNELVFIDFPKNNCPIYFFSPIESTLSQFKSFLPLSKSDKISPLFPVQKPLEVVEVVTE
jgi:hypothetical protein